VADVKCSKRLFEGVMRAGGRAETAPSGYVPVREAMRAHRAPLGGELSGHILFAENGWIGDGVYAAVRTLQAVAALPDGLAGFRRSLPPSFATPEFRLACADRRKAQVVKEVAARLAGRGGQYDAGLGLRVSRDDGWWLLRASGTESKLSCRCEADTPQGLERLRDELRRELALSGVAAEI
jgi:phosphomannomutase